VSVNFPANVCHFHTYTEGAYRASRYQSRRMRDLLPEITIPYPWTRENLHSEYSIPIGACDLNMNQWDYDKQLVVFVCVCVCVRVRV
jgi:hypothetical protein